jgi:FtsH-binding integral membrane protein
MAYSTETYYGDGQTAATAVPSERAKFIQLTYIHLAGAILAFAAMTGLLLRTPLGVNLFRGLASAGNLGMIALMVAFIGAGYIARWWAFSGTSKAMQYAGLGLYIVAQSIIFLPLLIYAEYRFPDQNMIAKAGLMTVGLFFGLTTAVFVTKADFSFMGTALCILSWVALLTIIAGWIFGFGLGLWFSGAMIALASGFIVYDTSNIIRHYPTDRYVGAALELFASVALLFYYILRFMMQQNSRD